MTDSVNKKNKIAWIVLYSLMGVSLVGSLVYFNFIAKEKQPTEVEANQVNGDATNGFDYTGFDHSEKTFSPETEKENEREVLLQFMEEPDDSKIDKIVSAMSVNETLDAIVVFPYTSMTKAAQTALVTYKDSGIQFGHDDADFSAIKGYATDTDALTYDLTVVIDSKGKIVTISHDFDKSIRLCNEAATLGKKTGKYIYEYSMYQYCTQDTFNIRETLGHLTLVNFWGTWCGPCCKEIPHFAKIKETYPDIEVVAIHSPASTTASESDTDVAETDEFKAEKQEFIDTQANSEGKLWKDFGFHFLQDSSADSFYTKLGGTGIYPMTFVLDENNVIKRIHNGSITYDDLESDYLTYKTA